METATANANTPGKPEIHYVRRDLDCEQESDVKPAATGSALPVRKPEIPRIQMRAPARASGRSRITLPWQSTSHTKACTRRAVRAPDEIRDQISKLE